MAKIKSEIAEMESVLAVAKAMAVAARTAPKARAEDAVETLIVWGEELELLGKTMETHGKNTKNSSAFNRDAKAVRNSHAVLLVGLKKLGPKKMDKPLNCGGCGHGDCAGFLKAEKKQGQDFEGPVCLFQAFDLGIALSSACVQAARFYVDNRMMYTTGGPARKLSWMESKVIIGISLSCTGKNIYFDRD
jgi:uncharacterized ferredoxin-like protein